VANVMQQRRQPQVLSISRFKRPALFTQFPQDATHDAKHSQAVRKTAMRCIGIYEVTHPELFQRAQSLKRGSVYDTPFVFRKLNLAVNVVHHDLSSGLGRGSQKRILALTGWSIWL
jgi:hypothetical protein